MLDKQCQTVREEGAHLLKVAEVTLRRLIKTGESRAVYIGKGRRIGSGNLDASVVDCATRPSGTAGGVGAVRKEPLETVAEAARDQRH